MNDIDISIFAWFMVFKPTSFCERMNDIDISIFPWFMVFKSCRYNQPFSVREWMILISLFSHDLWSLNPVDTTNLFLWENEWYWYLYFPMIYGSQNCIKWMNDIDISIFPWFMVFKSCRYNQPLSVREWMILISLFSHDLWSLNPVDTANLFLWEKLSVWADLWDQTTNLFLWEKIVCLGWPMGSDSLFWRLSVTIYCM